MTIKKLNIQKIIPDITTRIKRETFKSGKISYAAGTVGTRALQINFPETTKFQNLNVIDARIVFVGNSSAYHPMLFWSETKYYINFYRCSSSAYKSTWENDIIFEVTYIE